MFREQIREIIEPHSGTTISRVFDWAMMALIVVVTISFSVETLPGLSEDARHLLAVIEGVTIFVFTVEYAARVYVTRPGYKFVLSWYGVIDALSILPFYLGFVIGADVNIVALRTLRLFRIVRTMKLLRYSKAIQNLRDALYEVREELVLYLLATMFMIYFASAGIYYFEHDHPTNSENYESVFHAMWWSVVTLTTVGYGDVYPMTIGGRIFTSMILLCGLGVISVPSGLIASGLIRAKEKHAEKQGNQSDSSNQ